MDGGAGGLRNMRRSVGNFGAMLVGAALGSAGCASTRPGTELPRRGDEIVVCGRFFHTGAPVVLWTDPGGYDAYRVERRFAPIDESAWEHSASIQLKTPNRYGIRAAGLTADALEQVRGGGWNLPMLRDRVDQFVIHFDACGTSRRSFQVLHDERGLSVHFMLDLDGTIYQTLDVKERAWHATTSNDRSVGVEIANLGAFGPTEKDDFARWYIRGADGHTAIAIPAGFGAERTPGFVGQPARDEPVVGPVQGQTLRQYDLTPQQYESLTKLTAALCTVLPKIRCDYPHDSEGRLIPAKLPDNDLAAYEGVLGHYHIQTNKVDPGPAFQWDRVIQGARRLMGGRPSL
jgi:N-acetylmuramoyl-L-alanine amidase